MPNIIISYIGSFQESVSQIPYRGACFVHTLTPIFLNLTYTPLPKCFFGTPLHVSYIYRNAGIINICARVYFCSLLEKWNAELEIRFKRSNPRNEHRWIFRIAMLDMDLGGIWRIRGHEIPIPNLFGFNWKKRDLTRSSRRPWTLLSDKGPTLETS